MYLDNLINATGNKHFAGWIYRKPIDATFRTSFNIPTNTSVKHFPIADFAIGTGSQHLNAGWKKLCARKLRVSAQNMLSSHAPCRANKVMQTKSTKNDQFFTYFVFEIQTMSSKFLRYVPNDARSITWWRYNFTIKTVEL